jgi:hypothetical protein
VDSVLVSVVSAGDIADAPHKKNIEYAGWEVGLAILGEGSRKMFAAISENSSHIPVKELS